ncbi:MAG: MotA/TolQ/ExbB proton channel family protein [Candidatus Kapabacteria bacterium]|nr:MotA/TolQ/ExbB proton channel family protein [Candidatus Kapabacteria bacterium]
MKNIFNILVITLAMAIAFSIYLFYFGNPNNFEDPASKKKPKQGNIVGMIYTGGPIVGILIGLIIIVITFTFERYFSINKAKGKGNTAVYLKKVLEYLQAGNYDDALRECEQQRGSLANIMRAAIERFKTIEHDDNYPTEKKLAEVQRAIDEATNLETPLLEKNLVILSTVASISTLFGLLGTTIGMIRAFAAFGETGTVDATQLAIGISEALYNTAGGLMGAIIGIVAYNFFTTKVDDYVYMIDEAILGVTQIFTIRTKK